MLITARPKTDSFGRELILGEFSVSGLKSTSLGSGGSSSVWDDKISFWEEKSLLALINIPRYSQLAAHVHGTVKDVAQKNVLFGSSIDNGTIGIRAKNVEFRIKGKKIYRRIIR